MANSLGDGNRFSGKTGRRNLFCFGLGTIGRDMVYAMVSMYLMFYLTEVVQVGAMEGGVLAWITGIMLVFRIFDAVNDPLMGTITDNTVTRFGKFKPWIAIGAVSSGAVVLMLFTDFGLTGAAFVAVFAILYLLWDITYTMNDIPYWSMLPNLSPNQKEREKIGSFAKICANIGLFAVAAGIIPITNALGEALGSMKTAYTVFAAAVVIILIAGQCITLFGVKEPRMQIKPQSTSLKQMLKAIFKNDQLLWTAISMALFMIGYVTTTGFGTYFFKYDYGDENMYSVFTIVLGVSQLAALAVFPLVSRALSRRQIYTIAMVMVTAGYIIFMLTGYLFPMHMAFIAIAGVLLFVGQAGIQLLMLVFLADTVEYGEWKLGRRNEAVTFSIQPFINKMGAAVSSGLTGLVLLITSIGTAAGRYADTEGIVGAGNAGNPYFYVTDGDRLVMRLFMLIIPMLFIAASWLIYMFKYKIDKKKYDEITADLKKRRAETPEGGEPPVINQMTND